MQVSISMEFCIALLHTVLHPLGSLRKRLSSLCPTVSEQHQKGYKNKTQNRPDQGDTEVEDRLSTARGIAVMGCQGRRQS